MSSIEPNSLCILSYSIHIGISEYSQYDHNIYLLTNAYSFSYLLCYFLNILNNLGNALIA